jgi:hypothetical protein
MEDEDDERAWLLREKKKAALRILIVGLLIMTPASIWLAVYHDWDLPDSPISRIRVVGFCAIAVGACLASAGVILMLRVRKLGQLPKATAREK